MSLKSKQGRLEEIKTISIAELTQLKFRILKPAKGQIEIVNAADMGRICTLRISDFRSTSDARIYAQLLVLAPLLLDENGTDEKIREAKTKKLRKRIAFIKKKVKSQNKTSQSFFQEFVSRVKSKDG